MTEDRMKEASKIIIDQLQKIDEVSKFYKDTHKTMIANLYWAETHKTETAAGPKKWYVESSGILKCDTEDCPWNINVIREDLYLWRNCLCPICGGNVLTDKDWAAMLSLNSVMGNPIIRSIEWIGEKLGFKKHPYLIKMDGTGTIKIKEV